MSFTLLAFGSKPATATTKAASVRPLSSLRVGEAGVVVEVRGDANGRTDRLLSLGVAPGASVTVLQTFPGIVFLCDQTELAIERGVAHAIRIRPLEIRS